MNKLNKRGGGGGWGGRDLTVNFVFVCMTAQGNIEFLSRLEFGSLNIKPSHICHTSSDRSCHPDYIGCFLCLTEAAERSSVQAQVSILIHTCMYV